MCVCVCALAHAFLKVDLLLLDKPWFDALSLTIETLAHDGDPRDDCLVTISYPPQADFKVKVIVLEAATRISSSMKFQICSEDTTIQAFEKYVTGFEGERTPSNEETCSIQLILDQDGIFTLVKAHIRFAHLTKSSPCLITWLFSVCCLSHLSPLHESAVG